ncbi:MAG: O-antigen ligase family protein [Planctomycetes bacterium]|nr:O-antigen ligase family protein [Planctomycetota bacterium]
MRRRQVLFFTVLLLPLMALLGLVGVVISRVTGYTLPIAAGGAMMGIILGIVVFGVNWRIGLYAIMFLVLWDRWLLITERGGLNATKIAIGLTIIFMAGAILSRELPRWWERLVDAIPLVALGFVLMTLWSFAWTPHPDRAIDFLTRRLNCVVLLALVMVAVTDREVLHRAVLFFVLGGIVCAALAMSELFTGKSILELRGLASEESGKNVLQEGFGGRLRIVGPSGDAPFWSLAISAPGILLFGLLFYYRDWKKRLVMLAGVLLVALNIMATGARGGALCFLAGCAAVMLLCPIKHKASKVAVAIAAFIILLGAMLLFSDQSAAGRIADPTRATSTVDYRISNWYMVWDMYEQRPWTGHGVNTYTMFYPWYRIPGSSGEPVRPLNSFMQALQESGIQCVLAYTLLYVFSWFAAGCAALSTSDRRLRFEATALIGVVFGFFLFAGTSNVLENELYFLIFGLCGACYNVARQEHAIWPTLGADFMQPAYQYRLTAALEARQRAKYPVGG